MQAILNWCVWHPEQSQIRLLTPSVLALIAGRAAKNVQLLFESRHPTIKVHGDTFCQVWSLTKWIKDSILLALQESLRITISSQIESLLCRLQSQINDILAKEVRIKISLHQNKFKQEQLFQPPLKILPETLASQMWTEYICIWSCAKKKLIKWKQW